jgi:hypothetical protein
VPSKGTIVEMKLAKNSKLKQNLTKQTEFYQKASDACHAIKIILFFSEEEEVKATSTLSEFNLVWKDIIVLIDTRSDNKPSGSKA